jgi:hypothetical protein
VHHPVDHTEQVDDLLLAPATLIVAHPS